MSVRGVNQPELAKASDHEIRLLLSQPAAHGGDQGRPSGRTNRIRRILHRRDQPRAVSLHVPGFPRPNPGLEVGTAITLAFPRSPMVMAPVGLGYANSGGRQVPSWGWAHRSDHTSPVVFRRSGPVPPPGFVTTSGRSARCGIAFQNGTRLRYQGEFYQLTLMTPFFNPGPEPVGGDSGVHSRGWAPC